MAWRKILDHDWQEPLALAADYAGHDMALLYSSRTERYSGQQSFLLLDPITVAHGHRWSELPLLPDIPDDKLPYMVGFLGYGMRNDSEQLSRGEPSIINLPDFQFVRYGRLFRFDHTNFRIEEYRDADAGKPQQKPATGTAAQVKELASNFTRTEYEQAVADTLKQIAAGNFYQANLTRKFFGSFAAAPDYFALFRQLCHASAAPFSAYLRHGDTAILSSSPESFLSIGDNVIISRPIKGSAPRGEDDESDRAIREALVASAKNQAENLMIVDLMRHDLARVSEPGSVKVAEQSALYSYPTIHHLVSTITAQKRTECHIYDVLSACFPPGSMTGAPKIAAMEWCTAQEKLERGVYSGALGWLGTNGRCDLSVVIRTLICQGDRFEFQVGGGIVADSTPEDEWRETLVKARGIAKALGIAESQLESL